ncbi:hypothetical protein [Dyella sp.]|uniref:hypothetical protein n=1 Tax=Dyella sp. TaxID=1869338 RepID=UPI002ED51AA7
MKGKTNLKHAGPMWNPTLKRTFRDSNEWMATTGLKELDVTLASLEQKVLTTGIVERNILVNVGRTGYALGVKACALSQSDLRGELIRCIDWSVSFCDLAFRFNAATSMKREDQYLLPFPSGMAVAGITMLSRWESARISASLLIEVAHKEQVRHAREIRKIAWGNGTHVAFLIYLLAEAFGIPTHYEPAMPFLEAYKQLLKVWRTKDKVIFQDAMLAAADFHISRSKGATERNNYEFDDYFDRIYPAELLAVQALRRRDGLPEFQTGHLLVDTPWSIIRDAEPVEPHPVFIAIQDRMRQDYPGFV